MKKFKFSLENVLKQRQIEVELRQKELFEAEVAYDQEIQNLQDMIDQKSSALSQRSEMVQGSGSWVNHVEQINLYLGGQDVRITRQNERLIEFKKVVESRREILQKALSEAKMIEKLREKKKKAFLVEVADKEQKEMDEISVLRFSRIENK